MQQVYEWESPLCQLKPAQKKKRCEPTTQIVPKIHTNLVNVHFRSAVCSILSKRGVTYHIWAISNSVKMLHKAPLKAHVM